MSRDKLLDITWELFNQLKDTNSDHLARACADLIDQEGFDINCLPEDIYNNVHEILKARALDTWATDEAMEVAYA